MVKVGMAAAHTNVDGRGLDARSGLSECRLSSRAVRDVCHCVGCREAQQEQFQFQFKLHPD